VRGPDSWGVLDVKRNASSGNTPRGHHGYGSTFRPCASACKAARRSSPQGNRPKPNGRRCRAVPRAFGIRAWRPTPAGGYFLACQQQVVDQITGEERRIAAAVTIGISAMCGSPSSPATPPASGPAKPIDTVGQHRAVSAANRAASPLHFTPHAPPARQPFDHMVSTLLTAKLQQALCRRRPSRVALPPLQGSPQVAVSCAGPFGPDRLGSSLIWSGSAVADQRSRRKADKAFALHSARSTSAPCLARSLPPTRVRPERDTSAGIPSSRSWITNHQRSAPW